MVLSQNQRLKATVLRNLVQLRLEDARTLLLSEDPRRRNGAAYLAGYAVECALKARLCADRGELFLDPEFYVHDFVGLARRTQLWPEIETDQRVQQLFAQLDTQWSVHLRYAAGHLDAQDVRRYIEKAEAFCRWLFAN